MNTIDPSPTLQQRDLARALAHRMLDGLRDEPGYATQIALHSMGHADHSPQRVADVLRTLIDLTWPVAGGMPSPRDDMQRKAIMRDLSRWPDRSVRDTALDFMGHAAHLHQMAGLLAREHLFATDRNDRGQYQSARRFLYQDPERGAGKKYRSAEDAVGALSAPAFEVTMTGHPTNTNSVASMRLQRQLGQAASTWMANGADSASEPALDTILHQFATTPLLPMKDGQFAPLNAPQEIETMLYFSGNLYTDVAQVYRELDSELYHAYGAQYAPETLKLGLNFHSWGSSGDKDGNKKVNGDTTLIAVAMHRAAITRRYADEMAPLLTASPTLAPLQQQLADSATAFETQADALNRTYAAQGYFTNEDFATAREHLRTALGGLTRDTLAEALANAYRTAPESAKEPTLNLLRRVRMFGLGFGHIEYREKAEEYERVVGMLIPDYAAMDEATRCATLSDLIAHPETLAPLTAALHDRLHDAAGKPYSDDDAAPIAYQTLHRMELARDFPDMIQNNVLAECGGTANMLEALLLQQVVATDGRRAMMGIIPLFEEHATLKAAPQIVEHALTNPIYQQHLAALSNAWGEPVTQQVQIAHSDNAKRAGMPAARALVYRAHEDLRGMMRDYNAAHSAQPVRLQFFEGGSQSDPYRGGARSISATVNEFNLHDFTKMTYQGGDLLNYFNLPASTRRLFLHNLTNNAQKNEQLPRRGMTGLDQAITDALDAAKDHYIRLFEDPEYVDLLNSIGYAESTAAGNTSTRAGARKAGSGKLENINTTRAIGLSETQQHAGLSPTWIGAQRIRMELEKRLSGMYHRPDARTAEGLHRCYLESPVFRDIVDRMMYGIARTDLEQVRKRSGNHILMGQLEGEYNAAFNLCMEAYSGKPARSFLINPTGHSLPSTAMGSAPLDLRRVIINQVYPHAADMFGDQRRLLENTHTMEQLWVHEPALAASEKAERASKVHNILDTVHHGRSPLIDDPSYAKIHCTRFNIERPCVPTPQARQR